MATRKTSTPAAPLPRATRPSVAEGARAGRLSSVTSALLVLKVFSEGEAELGISSLAKRLKLAKSTVHRLAVSLAAEGFLEQNVENGRYRLGLALFALGALVRQRMDVSNQARPLLGQLRDSTQEAVHLAILAQTDIMYLYNLESAQAIGIRSYIGARKPAFCTSEGRVLLAYAEPARLELVLQSGLTARTAKTDTDARALVALLDEVRRNGYATDDEESEEGMRGLAAPIRDISGNVIAAVGLAGPIQRITKKGLRAFVPQVVATADAVSQRLGFVP